jgi:glycosyltransferase involved in cell wall biosynthesis
MADATSVTEPLPAPQPRLVSVLTPLYHAGVEFLAEAYRSLAAQRLPDGWGWEWVVQDDAATEASRQLVADLAGGDARVRYAANGRQCGQAVTRTMAFQRSRGAFVYALDQDDMLLAGALAALAEVLDRHDNVMWVTGRVQRLFDDGRVAERVDPLGFGPVPAGHLLELFDQGFTTAFYPTATMFRRTGLHLLGGWPAVVAAEDAELQLAMGAAFDGWRVDHLLLSRRKWAGQAVLADWYQAPDLAAIATRYQRARAIDELRRAGWFVGR